MRLDLESEEEAGFPRPRQRIERKVSRANSKRAELIQRTLEFLGTYKGKPFNPKVFAIRTSHLSEDDLEYMLSSSKQFKPNPQACFWKILKESMPK